MTTYTVEFGKVGETRPVPELTVEAENLNEFTRKVEEHAIPHLRPVLTEMGRPELADCLFRINKQHTAGEFLWLDLAAEKGARFCPARITHVTTPTGRCQHCQQTRPLFKHEGELQYWGYDPSELAWLCTRCHGAREAAIENDRSFTIHSIEPFADTEAGT